MASTTRIASLAIGISLFAAFAPQARAQGIASNADIATKDETTKGNANVIEINEVERGFFLSVDYGANYFIPVGSADTGFVPINPEGTLPGTRMGIRAGYDVLNNVEADVFVVANFNEGLLKVEDAQQGVLTGDLSSFAPGVAVRFDFITSEDGRFFAFARAGVGYALWFPGKIAAPESAAGAVVGSVHADGSLGVEYYTKLRHLSFGLEADFQALIAPNAFAFALYPTLKYTF